MTNNLGLTQRTQLKKEASAGAGGTPDKELRGMMFERQPQVSVKQFTASGNKVVTSSRRNRKYDTWKVSGVPCFEELPFVYASLLRGGVTPTDLGTLGKQWVFTSDFDDVDPVDTFVMQQGNSVRARKGIYMFFNGLTETITSEDTSIDGTAISKYAARGATMNGSATKLPDSQITGDMYSVYIDPAFADIGTTQIHDAYSLTVGVDGKQDLRFPIDQSLDGSYAGPAEQAADWSLKIKIEDNTVADILEDAIDGNVPVYVRIEAIGDLIEALDDPDPDVFYTHTLDVACKVKAIGPGETDMGVYCNEYELTPWADADAGFAMKATVICTLGAL